MLPKELFENQSGSEQIVSESDRKDNSVLGWEITDIKWGDGIKVYIVGANFPQKGYAAPDAVWATNIVKRLIIKGIELVNPLRFNKIIENFADIGWKIMSPFILKKQYLTAFSREFADLIYNFLLTYGINQDTSYKVSQILAHIFEYDNAYRLRLEDLLSATTKEQLLNDPRKEINTLLTVNAERECQHPQVIQKFGQIGKILTMLLLIPKVRNALQQALEKCKYENLCLDNIDKYWACHRTDYNFMGLTYEQRGEMLKQAGYKRVDGRRFNL